MPSWAKGKKTGLACWSPGPRTHRELDCTSVCGSYSWELKTSPSLSLVLRAVPLEEEMATHSSFPAWKTPWTEGPGGLRSMGSQRARHDRATEQRAACLPGRAARCVRRVAPRWDQLGPRNGDEETLQEGSLQRHKSGLRPRSGAPVRPHSLSYSLRPLRDPPNLRIFQSDMLILEGVGNQSCRAEAHTKATKRPWSSTLTVSPTNRGAEGTQENKSPLGPVPDSVSRETPAPLQTPVSSPFRS